MHIATLKVTEIDDMVIHPSSAVQLATLQSDKVSSKISTKYVDYANIFLFDLIIEISENTNINKYIIKLEED